MYKSDFEAERKSREELNDQRLQLQEKLIAVEEELEAVKLANQIAEMQPHHGYPAGRSSVGRAEETSVGNIHQQRRIAQEQSAVQGAAATAAATVAPVETQPANRATLEVSSTL